jgi:opacity protein-like surface antigen
MSRRLLGLIGLWVLVCGPVPGASAQDVGAIPVPLVEVSAGYAYMRDTSIEENFPKGWYFSGGANLTNWFGVAGEITGAYKTFDDVEEIPDFSVKTNIYTFMAGPRFFAKQGRFVPFAQVLAGAAHLRVKTSVPAMGLSERESETKFAFQTGGGFTILLSENVGIRTAVDYRRIMLGEDDGGEDDSEVRGIAGIVFGWGAR